uniref:GDT1-like protein 2, chloroplastic n=1 Tax=Ciona intestinalis TaxID=7719 RepID=UPI000EF4C956|nr:GDT1-like protein 2, chloroplastic [Ciona intestinalis]|eukprot:XP_026694642.1 GDT1-like protein 2, chloroplastic [Ciona intestinalis]
MKITIKLSFAVVIAHLTVTFTRFGKTVFIKYIVQIILGIFGFGLLRDAWLTTACDTEQCDQGEIEVKSEKSENGNFCVTAFWKIFMLTCVAEMGDRSQVTTFLLSTCKDNASLLIGAACGYLISTLLAVYGASELTKRLPTKAATLLGGIILLSTSISNLITLEKY